MIDLTLKKHNKNKNIKLTDILLIKIYPLKISRFASGFIVKIKLILVPCLNTLMRISSSPYNLDLIGYRTYRTMTPVILILIGTSRDSRTPKLT